MLKKRELLEVKKLYWALWKSSGEMEEAITVQAQRTVREFSEIRS